MRTSNATHQRGSLQVERLNNQARVGFTLAFVVPCMVSIAVAPQCLFYVLAANAFAVAGILTFSTGRYPELRNIHGMAGLYLTAISSFAVLSYSASISQGSEQAPYIPGGDGEHYFALGVSLADSFSRFSSFWETLTSMRINYRGYPMILGVLFGAVGKSMFAGLALNYCLIIFSMLLTARFTLQFAGVAAAKATFALLALSPHLFAQGTILQKDAILVFGFALFLFASGSLLAMNNRRAPISLLWLVIAIGLIGITRIPFLVFFPLFLLFVFYFGSLSGRGARFNVIALLFIVLFALVGMRTVFDQFSLSGIEEATSTDRLTDASGVKKTISEKSSGMVRTLTAPIESGGVLRRTLMLPVLLGIQYALPFGFWNNRVLTDHTWFFATDQMHIFWLAILGPYLLITLLHFAKMRNHVLRAAFATGLMVYAVVAYTYLGVVPRYATPAMVFLFPAIGSFYAATRVDMRLKERTRGYLNAYYGVGILLLAFYFMR